MLSTMNGSVWSPRGSLRRERLGAFFVWIVAIRGDLVIGTLEPRNRGPATVEVKTRATAA